MPSPSGRFDYKSQADNTTQGHAHSVYSVHSNAQNNSLRPIPSNLNNRNTPVDSNASIVASEFQLPSGSKIFDHRPFLESNPHARLMSITVFARNYIVALRVKYSVPDNTQPVATLHYGSRFDPEKEEEYDCETLDIAQAEFIETVNC